MSAIKRIVVLALLALPLTGCFPANNPTLVCIRSHESANLENPWAANTGNGYFGAYQYTPGTLNTAAATVGRSDLVGLLPYSPVVSAADQDSVTLAYHNIVGDAPWGNLCN